MRLFRRFGHRGGLTLPVAAQPAKILTFEHKVPVKSTVPSLAGQTVNLYVRERVSASTKVDAIGADRVVLFVHGAGTPAEVAFDVPHSDYSWMAYLANAGFDVFAMDTTGYGRSVRPAEMNDPCNLASEQQAQFVPALIPALCDAKYPGQLTNLGSDWNDIDAVVDHIRTLRQGREGEPGGVVARWTARRRLRCAAPRRKCSGSCCWRLPTTAPPAAPPPALPNAGVVFNTQSRQEFDANWDRQLGCPNQFDPAVREVGVEGHDRVRSGRREMGERRAARAVHHHVGMERGDDSAGLEDPDAAHRRRARSTGARPSACKAASTTSVRQTRC